MMRAGATPSRLPDRRGGLEINRESRRMVVRLATAVLAAATALAPYALWRVSTAFFITISDLLFALAAILLIATREMPLRPFGSWTPAWLAAFVAMLTGLLIGSMINGDPARWLSAAAQYSFGFALLPFLLMPDDEGRAVILAKALLAGVAAMEAFGLLVYNFSGGSWEDHNKIAFEFISGTGRLGAFLGDPNWNGAIISMALPFALYLWWTGKVGNLVTLAVVLVLGGALVASGSVTGFASGLAAVSVFVIVAGGRASMKFALGIVLAAGLVLATGYRPPDVFQKRVASAIAEGDINQAGTFIGRLDLVKEAWGIVETTSIVGLGVDQYRVVSRQKAPVHNIQLLLWAEGGLLALIGWMIMMFVLAIGSLLACRVDRRAGALGLSVLLSFTLFSIAAPHMYARIWVVPLFAAAGIAFHARPKRRADAPYEYLYRAEERRNLKR